MPRSRGIGRTGAKHKRAANFDVHQQIKGVDDVFQQPPPASAEQPTDNSSAGSQLSPLDSLSALAGVSGPRSPDPRRPSSSIFWGPRSLMALDAGPAVVEAGRDRWCAADAGTRPHTLAHTDRVLTARAAGPFSRSPSSLSTILGYILAYVMRCARGCATRGSRWSRPGSREMRVCKSASVSPRKKYDVVA